MSDATATTATAITSGRRAPRSRFAPKVASGMRIEERDEQLLRDLFLHRLMSRRQIEKSYFSSTVRANARLRLLFDHGFVLRHYPPYAPFGAQAIYSVGKAALPLVSRRLELPLDEVKRFYQRTRTPTFIEHTLAIVDVWLAFREAQRKGSGWSIECWLAEMQCRHEWDIRASGGKWHKETFKPDAFVRLETPAGYHCFFIEVDLGHTSGRQFGGKLLTHRRYLESGLFPQTYGGETFRTLVFTTGARRLGNLRALAEEQKSDLFWFATLEDGQCRLTEAVWAVPFQSHAQALLAPPVW